jgi:thiol-disulfide isomerase/thioredoxin
MHATRNRSAGARWRAAAWAALLVIGVDAGTAVAGRRPAADGLDPARIRRELKGTVLRTIEGHTLNLGSLQGEVVVVNFWASWCTPCRKELPRLDALHASIAGRGGRVVAISIDHEARNVQRFARAQGLALPLYHDGPDGLARRLDLPHVPFTIVLDRHGDVALTTRGSDERALDEIAETTRRLMAAAEPPRTIAGETPEAR